MGKFNNPEGQNRFRSKAFRTTLLPLLLILPPLAFSQIVGELAEMDRLERRAEEAMAFDDPHGASLAIGKAAMMSSILGAQKGEAPSKTFWMALENFFRAQEDTYRAIALFDQAGGNPPPPAGVCQALLHAWNITQESHQTFQEFLIPANSVLAERSQRYLERTHEWQELIPELQEDLSC